jgi:hypothetical protein
LRKGLHVICHRFKLGVSAQDAGSVETVVLKLVEIKGDVGVVK